MRNGCRCREREAQPVTPRTQNHALDARSHAVHHRASSTKLRGTVSSCCTTRRQNGRFHIPLPHSPIEKRRQRNEGGKILSLSLQTSHGSTLSTARKRANGAWRKRYSDVPLRSRCLAVAGVHQNRSGIGQWRTSAQALPPPPLKCCFLIFRPVRSPQVLQSAQVLLVL